MADENTTDGLPEKRDQKPKLQQYVPVEGDGPGKVECSKCSAVDFGLPLKVERQYGKGGVLGPLLVTEILLPLKWSRVTISERLPGTNRETIRAVVFACPNCTVNVG
jgi:hypothetical protein